MYSPSGDNPPHEIWNETFSSQLESSHFVIDYLAQQLPNATIYPAMGNHGKSRLTYQLFIAGSMRKKIMLAGICHIIMLKFIVTCNGFLFAETWPQSEYLGSLADYQVGKS